MRAALGDRRRGPRARARGADRDRVGRDRRGRDRDDVRDGARDQRRGAPAAGGRSRARCCSAPRSSGSPAAPSSTTPLGAQAARGFPDGVEAWRVVSVVRGGRPPARRVGAASSGARRSSSCSTTRSRAPSRDRRVHLVTVYGAPGVGKSRLAREFIDGVERSTILYGRCLPYGEGVTYWAVAEMVKVAAGITDDDSVEAATEKLRKCCGDEAVADLLGARVRRARRGRRRALGVRDRVGGADLGHRARRPAAARARVRGHPLGRGADARPDRAPGGRRRGRSRLSSSASPGPTCSTSARRGAAATCGPTSIELEALPRGRQRAAGRRCSSDGDSRRSSRPTSATAVLATTEGNPLFIEETVRMLLESDGRADRHSAHRAGDDLRPDRPAARGGAGGAAAGRRRGRTFWSGADRGARPTARVEDGGLDELVERDFLVREPRSTIRGEEAYRFKHVLIRDVAYAGLSKSSRALLHRQMAQWLAGRPVARRARRDPRLPPRRGRPALGRARRARARRSRVPRRLRRSSRPAGARSRARRTPSPGDCSSARSSSSRRSNGATSPREPPGG